MNIKQGKNDPCNCGSGKKFKNCCYGKIVSRASAPSPDEFNRLVALFNSRRYAELENLTRQLIGRFPDSGFAWKLLGAALQMQGINALSAFQKTAELMPNDAEAHFNLGVVLKSLGQLDEAVSSYRRALQLNPAYAEAHSNLGNALRDLGQLESAVASYRSALMIKSNSATAHNSMGTALKDLGKLDAAIESYRRAIEIKPGYAEAHTNLGNALRDTGQIGDAIASYHCALTYKPDSAETHFNLGLARKELGQLDEAATSFHRALELSPDSANVHFNLGNVLKTLGQLDNAAESYRHALQLNPGYIEALNNLGLVLKDLGQPDSAIANYRKALEIYPDYAEAHSNLGNIQTSLGLIEDAFRSHRRAVELKPDSAYFLTNLGNAQKDVGQIDDAFASYRRALEIDPSRDEAILGITHLRMINGNTKDAEEELIRAIEINPDNLGARLLLATIKTPKPGDKNLAALLEAEQAASNRQFALPVNQTISLYFALGKCFEEAGNFDRAFPYFIEGCKLKRATFEYDAAHTTRHFSDIMRVFDQVTIECLRGMGNSSKVPIFVLGMPRSGTTLTEQIIASHPDVYGAGELPDMPMISQHTVAGVKGFPDSVLKLDRVNLSKWADDYVVRLRQRAPDARYITDKLPDNFRFIGLIHVMLPNAKIIHVNRNPVDTCLSCFTTLFKPKYTYDLAELGRYYVDYARLMDHWRSVLPAGAFLEVQYEDVVADQERQARRMIDFCGLEWNDACLDFHKNKRSVNTASMTQVRRPIYKSSMERWRPYEKYLGPLLDALGDLAPSRP